MLQFNTLKYGSNGDQVIRLQVKLNSFGAKLDVDGYFGKDTEIAVRVFQCKNNLMADGIVGQQTLRALGLIPNTPVKAMPKYLVLHCTASQSSAEGWKASDVVFYHTNKLGWDRPGYSKIVEFDGKIVDTWNVDLSDGFQPYEITYGAAEYNPFCVHVCYIGGIDASGQPKDTRTREQYESLSTIVVDIVRQCPDILVCGHNQLHNKACPSFWVPDFCDELGLPQKNIFREDQFGYKKYLAKLNG